MATPVARFALAKLSAPRLSQAVPRPRLLDRIEKWQDIPVLWVEGPAGSGKSTLIADALNARGAPQFWYHVDEGDADPSSLVSYLIELAERAGAREPFLPYLTSEHLAGVEAFSRHFFRSFFRRLPAGSVLVFDDCHRVDTPDFLTVLRVACEEVPPGMQVIAASRHRLPAALVGLAAKGVLSSIVARDLVLDLRETEAIVRAAGTPDAVRTEALHRLSGGWVAGVVLLLHRRELPVAAPDRLDLGSREAVFDYFAGEILDAADANTRDLLLKTSILPVITEDLARALTGNAGAAALLERLYRRHYFTTRHENDGALTYAYHDLFRAFLLERLTRELSSEALRDLQAHAGARLESGGFAAHAVDLYRKAGDADGVARLVRAHAHRLVDQGQWQTLATWLDALPGAQVEQDPWLLYFRAVVTTLAAPAHARALFERAYEEFTRSGDDAGQFSAAFGLMEVMLVISETFKPWDRWIDVLEPLLELRPPSDPGTAVRAWYTFLYACLYRRPAHRLIPTAVGHLEREFSSGRINPAQAVQAGTGLLAYAHFTSDEGLAARVMPALQSLLSQEHLAVFSRIWARVWIGVYHFFNARYVEALENTTLARDDAARHGVATSAHLMGCYRIQSLANLGRAREALGEAAKLRAEIVADRGYPAAYLNAVTGLAHFIAGDVPAAIDSGDRAIGLWRDNGFVIAELAWEVIQAIYLTTQGDRTHAEALRRDAEQRLAGTVCNYMDPVLALLRSESALAAGDEPLAISHLRSGLALARNRKRAAALSWARPMLPTLFSLACRNDIERGVVAALVAEWHIPPPEPAAADWPWAATIRTFGGFEIAVGGQPPPRGRKSHRRLLAFIKFLAIAGLDGESVASVSEALWPDADGDIAAGNLRTTIFRARKLLGDEAAIFIRDGRVGFNPGRVWVDTHALGRVLRERDERLASLEPGVARLYRGELLPDDDDPWVLAARREWRSRILAVGLSMNP
ncbi:MAG: hypothetical protein U1F52_12110 [Burkholderiales bacterium]